MESTFTCHILRERVICHCAFFSLVFCVILFHFWLFTGNRSSFIQHAYAWMQCAHIFTAYVSFMILQLQLFSFFSLAFPPVPHELILSSSQCVRNCCSTGFCVKTPYKPFLRTAPVLFFNEFVILVCKKYPWCHHFETRTRSKHMNVICFSCMKWGWKESLVNHVPYLWYSLYI